MLILSLRVGDSLVIGDQIKVQLLSIRPQSMEARIGVSAPKEIPIHRDDIRHVKESPKSETLLPTPVTSSNPK